MTLESVKKGRQAYAVLLVITIASVCTQSTPAMTAGLIINAVIWWTVVWETQRDISRLESERVERAQQ